MDIQASITALAIWSQCRPRQAMTRPTCDAAHPTSFQPMGRAPEGRRSRGMPMTIIIDIMLY